MQANTWIPFLVTVKSSVHCNSMLTLDKPMVSLAICHLEFVALVGNLFIVWLTKYRL